MTDSMERVELGEQPSSGDDGTVGSGANKSNDDDKSKRFQRRLCLGFLVVLALCTIGGVIAYFVTRPENLEVVDSTQMETLPSLIKIASLGGGGGVLIQFTQLLEDPSQLFYYVEMQDVDIQSVLKDAGGNDEDLDNLALYLTRPTNPTIDNLSNGIKIENIMQVIESPYRLPESFIPGDYNGVVLAKETDGATTEIISRSAFDVVADPARNVGAPTAPAPTPVAAPSVNAPSSAEPPAGSPVSPPTSSSSLPPILVSTLDSDAYNIAGTITINYVSSFVGGNVVTGARLQFDISAVARAPGPFLYLSRRPYSQTEGRDLSPADIYIPIDQAIDGSFTVVGKFDQSLDEISAIDDINDFTNGSWIVWCAPFGIWLGGGSITVQQ